MKSNHFQTLLRTLLALSLAAVAAAAQEARPATSALTIQGTRFYLDGKPFYFEGVSFFNALYNKEFNQSPAARERWLRKFKSYGITVLRVWADWRVTNGWVDEGPDNSLYVYPEMGRNGRLFVPKNPQLNPAALSRVKDLALAANREGMVVELCLFTHYLVYPRETRSAYIRLVTRELKPYRNLYFEIWNEWSDDVVEHYKEIKRLDPARLVTNSPEGPNYAFGSDEESQALDFLSPHTTRKGNFWETAPLEIRQLLETYKKPVVDDEPARCGTLKFGGSGQTEIAHHIAQIDAVRKIGGYHTYHHDMFQLGYGDPSIPPSGIPDPEFSPFHLKVFQYLRSIAPPEVTKSGSARMGPGGSQWWLPPIQLAGNR
ncbi:MAG: hypothetical protein ABSC23_12305 [Bryobacteraceae bacterium]